MLTDPAEVEKIVWIIFGVAVMVTAIIGKVRKREKEDHSWFILAVSALVVMVAWIILAHITPLIWWKYYLRYCYLGIFPIITLSAYLMEDIAVWYCWDYAGLMLVLILFIAVSLWGCLVYPCIILAYICEVGEKFIVALKRWRQNPVV